MLNKDDVTPAIMVKNEEFWIHYVLRDVMTTFGRVVLLDTGSTDLTVSYAQETAEMTGCDLTLIQEDYGSDANKIGNGRNVLREFVNTEFMFLIDGDEIWTQPQLDALLRTEIGPEIQVLMAGSHNIEDVDGKLNFRVNDIANKDVLFRPGVRWSRTDYPFEGYGLSNDLPMDLVQYVPASIVFCYHMRHTSRSALNAHAFFRDEKYNYFKYDGPFEPFNVSEVLGQPVINITNPYL